MGLKQRIQEDMKAALKARETARLGALRLLLAAVKQKEVDERGELDDAGVLVVIDKMIKQRREALAQYEKAGRQDLADAERLEVEVLSGYLPRALTAPEIDAAVAEAIAACSAAGIQDMGKVMAVLKPKLAGRADMGQVSARVRAALAK